MDITREKDNILINKEEEAKVLIARDKSALTKTMQMSFQELLNLTPNEKTKNLLRLLDCQEMDPTSIREYKHFPKYEKMEDYTK